MKFKDVKKGDILFTQVFINTVYSRIMSFQKAVKVVKVTETQFTTEDMRRYRKKDGKEISDYVFIEKHGKDQTREIEEFKNKLALIRDCNRLIRNSRVNSDHSEDKIKKLIKILKSL